MNRMKIALTKGRLEDKAIELFEKSGIDCSPLKIETRKLVHALPNDPLDVLLVKAQDVITYVEHGVCDMGIVGKDTILEYGRSFFEVLDLKFGKCRLVLAAKEGEDLYGKYRDLRIATKYPRVARNYFESKGNNVEIIKIESSVEIAPLMGLADAIVDIVETGTTLRENGLCTVEEITNVSARLIVNVASMKINRLQIMSFVEKLNRSL
ncbi:MAG: ATP phosphoribosyltransferase [Eubacteriales bacterium]|jgi:ATP phosphoribosyltransferase